MKIDGTPLHTKDETIIKLVEITLIMFIEVFKKKKEFDAFFQIFDGSKMHIFGSDFIVKLNKKAFTNFLMNQCIKLSAHYVIAASDAWISKRHVRSSKNFNEIAKDYQHVTPSKDPNRQEAILTSIIYPKGNCDVIIAPYTRSPKGFPIFEENPAWIDSDSMFLNLVKPWG